MWISRAKYNKLCDEIVKLNARIDSLSIEFSNRHKIYVMEKDEYYGWMQYDFTLNDAIEAILNHLGLKLKLIPSKSKRVIVEKEKINERY